MKKLSLFMLMAVGLLISGNVGAAKGQGHPEPQEDDVAKVSIDIAGVITTNYYAILQDAFDDLPDNSYPATLKLLNNTVSTYTPPALKLSKHQNVTIDLNNFTIAANTNVKGTSAVILNYGTLTIEDNSEEGNGCITNVAKNPDIDWGGEGQKEYPGYANNVITNYGTLIVNSGTIESTTNGAATYCVDNSSNGGVSPLFILNGGTLRHTQSTAVRLHCNSSTGVSQMEMNGGIIEAASTCIWLHLPSSDKAITQPAKLVINGGELKSPENKYCFYDYSYGAKFDDVNITITGGTFDGYVFFGSGAESTETIKISGGIFKKMPIEGSNLAKHGGCITGGIYICPPVYTVDQSIDPWWSVYSDEAKAELEAKYPPSDDTHIIVDGNDIGWGNYWIVETKTDVYTRFQSNVDGLIAEGYKAVPCTDEGFNPATDLKIETLNKKDVEVGEGEKNLNEIVPEIEPDGTTEITIVPTTTVDPEGDMPTTIINITENTNVNKITVTTTDEKGEAQIVVKSGVTLNVGNGGIVSENDILTTVLVETGGTLVVGTGGVEQDGLATPIKIQTSEKDGTGTLVFNPNSQTEKTKNYAEVDLYTYCKKIGDGKYTWQQFAIPVTGLANDKVAKNPDKTSYVFEWDYATYSWSQLSDWAQLDEPFAGYDITNISEDGGVVYTFKGDLIGNQNIQLTLPHKDYCVMGNSYTAPIDIEALFEQINKEMSANTIEKTVYKYDAKAGYYVYTNELEQTLDKMGVVKASFTDIKPMEGFLLNLQSGNTAGVMLNYANAVFNPAMDKATGAKAPRQNNSTDLVVANINVMSAHSADRMTLVEGDEFSAEIENGKDAFKYLNEGANLYAFDGTNKLAMVATDNLENTMLAFQAAEDAEYTLTFDRALNTEYVLVDMMNGNEVAMTEGNTYTFFATPNTLDPARFMVKANAQAPTNMERTKATKVAKGIYTITGQYLGESNQWNAMPQGVYMVNGIKVIK